MPGTAGEPWSAPAHRSWCADAPSIRWVASLSSALPEDFVTGIALREQGWRLLYLQQKLGAGLTAETMADFVRQRQRWANGTLQSLSLPQGPLQPSGLSLGQRLAYLEGVVHWLNNLPGWC